MMKLLLAGGMPVLTDGKRVEAWLKAQPHFAVLPVDYNALVANPMPQAAAINEFLGRALDLEKMIQAVNSRLYRQRIA